MRKNAITWRRTWLGSISEIICPVMLMFVLLYFRSQILTEEIGDFDITLLKKPFFPTTGWNSTTGLFDNTNFQATKEGFRIKEFMSYTNYTTSTEIGGQAFYSSLTDPLGPYYFFPPHCYNNSNRFESPIIAYIHQENQIQADMIQQLDLLFEKQQFLLEYTKELLFALQDAANPNSIALVLLLLEGAPPEDQIELLGQFGVPPVTIDALKGLLPPEPDLPEQEQLLDLGQSSINLVSHSKATHQEELSFPVQKVSQQLQYENNKDPLMQSNHLLNEVFGLGSPLTERQINRIALVFGSPKTLDRDLMQNLCTQEKLLNKLLTQLVDLTELQFEWFYDQTCAPQKQPRKQSLQKKTTTQVSKFPLFQGITLLVEEQNDAVLPNLTNTTSNSSLSENDSKVFNQSTPIRSLLEQLNEIEQTQQRIQAAQNELANSTTVELVKNIFQINQTQAESLVTTLQQATQPGNDQRLDLTQALGIPRPLLDRAQAQTNMQLFGKFNLVRFETLNELQDYIGSQTYGTSEKPGICFGFQVQERSNNHYELDLVFNDLWPSKYRSLPNQKLPAVDRTAQQPKVTEYGYYVNNGFSFMQNLAANTILRRKTNVSNSGITAMIVPTKIAPVVIDNFVIVLQLTLTLFVLLMFIPVLYRTVYRVVYEKASRAKESMLMMGLTQIAYWISWLAYYTLVNTAIATLSWSVIRNGVFTDKSSQMLFLVIWLFGQSLAGLVLITQSIFTSPRAAAITTTVFYFGSAILGGAISDEDTSKFKKIVFCMLFPTVTISETLWVLVQLDSSGEGVNFQNWSLEFHNFSVRLGIIMLFSGGLLNLLIGAYMECVMPKTFGRSLDPLFCLKSKQRPSVSLNDLTQNNIDDQELSHCFEPASYELQEKQAVGDVLDVKMLRKVYAENFVAVQNLNMTLYRDQISVLLGHNGAGKTTTISMLTGLIEHTEGSAQVFGISIFEQMQKLRQIMGVCPQHDVHFEMLTTEEHISLFYDLKGANNDQRVKNAEIQKMMKDVGVFDKRGTLASQLSGGNKRKLSVALALCGGSRFVVLDEPTSGMDLQARRQLWNMLKEYKKDRIILLTTHYMDEADIIGDRIAIMSSGKLKCAGSSIFLKNRFGAGYNFSVLRSDSADDSSLILNFFKDKLGSAIEIQSESKRETVLLIPFQYAGKLQVFLHELDQKLVELEIQSYGVSISTLEEVFIKIGLSEQKKETAYLDQNKGQQIDQKQFSLNSNLKDLDKSFKSNLQALLVRRYHNYRRNKRAVFNESILPALIMIVGTSLQQFATTWQSPSRLMAPDRLPRTQRILVNSLPDLNESAGEIMQNLPQIDFQIQANQEKLSFDEFQEQVYQFGRSRSVSDPYLYGSYQIYEANKTSQQYTFASFVNLTSQDATGLFPQFMYESVLKTATNDSSFDFKTKSIPFPPTYEVKIRFTGPNTGTIIFLSSIAYSMMITAVVSYLVVERINGLKHLQLVSGMQLEAYWTANFVFDFIKFQPTIMTTIALFKIFNMNFTAAWTTYLALPFGILPFTYVSSFLFTEEGAAQTFTMFLHFLTLAILSSIVFALRIVPDKQQFGDKMHQIMQSVPTYLVGSSLYCDSSCQTLSNSRLRANATGKILDPDKWAPQNIPSDIQTLFIHFFVWFIILALIEKGFLKRIHQALLHKDLHKASDINLDEDVLKEQKEVESTKSGDGKRIEVRNLRKVYSVGKANPFQQQTFVAVNNLSFQVGPGDCFALLGVNGAGKSTTYKTLTGEVEPTSGFVKLCGYDLQMDFEKARQTVGYCPQANLLFEFLTVEEHIYFYAQIKGIPATCIQTLLEKQIHQLDLSKQRFKLAGTLSGGNKRKLCVAIALIGSPPVILLDEPSAGMDPAARRFMWTILCQERQRQQSSIVISTHSMDEAECLSTKMGIMVKGGILRCIGSVQHIKNKFGQGYTIEVKIKRFLTEQNQKLVTFSTPNSTEIKGQEQNIPYQSDGTSLMTSMKLSDKLKSELAGYKDPNAFYQLQTQANLLGCIYLFCLQFGQVDVLEKYEGYMRIRLPNQIESVGSIFKILDQLGQLCNVSEYSVSQTTLEQIFQGFADPNYNLNADYYYIKEGELVRSNK